MKILGIEHIGIAVDDLNKTSSFWGNILNILHTHTEVVESEKVMTTIFDTKKGKIELLSPSSSNSVVEKFIKNKVILKSEKKDPLGNNGKNVDNKNIKVPNWI